MCKIKHLYYEVQRYDLQKELKSICNTLSWHHWFWSTEKTDLGIPPKHNGRARSAWWEQIMMTQMIVEMEE